MPHCSFLNYNMGHSDPLTFQPICFSSLDGIEGGIVSRGIVGPIHQMSYCLFFFSLSPAAARGWNTHGIRLEAASTRVDGGVGHRATGRAMAAAPYRPPSNSALSPTLEPPVHVVPHGGVAAPDLKPNGRRRHSRPTRSRPPTQCTMAATPYRPPPNSASPPAHDVSLEGAVTPDLEPDDRRRHSRPARSCLQPNARHRRCTPTWSRRRPARSHCPSSLPPSSPTPCVDVPHAELPSSLVTGVVVVIQLGAPVAPHGAAATPSLEPNTRHYCCPAWRRIP